MGKTKTSEAPSVSKPTETADAAVMAMTIEWWPIDRPKPYVKNARKWSQAAIEKVAASIREFGWRQPLVCDVHDVIVIGHLRWASAQFLNLTKVPVHVASDLTEAQIKALRIADNKLHEQAQWDGALSRVRFVGSESIDVRSVCYRL